MDKKKIPRARAKDTIQDLYEDGMMGSKGWTKPRHQKKKESETRRQAQVKIEKKE